ncbi:uncharacterized protein Triagg1_2124 [Trichoderma aggressivum f. europaeum]|uniref:Uncharacterized protein n=1 Tax=Trichoderma aggressivum f. europaeum TaxID=173218 RepID=A0AAE1IJA3_9HYPO|nr:hypothetical protein Triagg1_2124 [Trichoderma aggressivum f. europaeum]
MLSASCGKTDGNSLGKPYSLTEDEKGKKETTAAVEKLRGIVIRSNGNGPGSQDEDAVRLALVKNNQDWAAAAVAHMGKPTAISSVQAPCMNSGRQGPGTAR